MPNDPDQKPSLLDRLVNAFFRAILWVALALPYERRVPVAGWIFAHIVAPVAGWRRRIRGNLALACPDLPAAEVERLVRAVPDNVGRTMIEMYSAKSFLARVEGLPLAGPGAAAFEAALAAERPIIVAAGHFGNYDVPRAAVILRGHRVGGLYRPMKNVLFNAHYIEAMSSIGTPVFPRGKQGMAGMVRFLKSGGILGLLMDQYMRHGAHVTFFGKIAMTATSAADLALKYDAEIIPIYGIRKPDGLNFEVFVDSPIPRGTPVEMTQGINDSLERIVRAHMEQWFWIHRRWKRRDLPDKAG